jgi:integrase
VREPGQRRLRRRLANAVGLRYRALVLLGTFASLRWGEPAALRRKDINLETMTVTVERSLTELAGGGYQFGPPKSAVGRRPVPFPDLIVADLRAHLGSSTGPGADDLVFTSPTGTPLRHSNFRCRVWLPALTQAELPGIHFHDLRHTGNMLMASAGANLRELMERMGHSTTRAALIYLHSTTERQRTLADTLGDLAQAELKKVKATGSPHKAFWHGCGTAPERRPADRTGTRPAAAA